MNDYPPQPSRRDVLRGALATGASLSLAGGLSSCGSRGDVARVAAVTSGGSSRAPP
ncbi:twin-arginine translocation signal domain-containing protein [Streptosporangium lutulentum]